MEPSARQPFTTNSFFSEVFADAIAEVTLELDRVVVGYRASGAAGALELLTETLEKGGSCAEGRRPP